MSRRYTPAQRESLRSVKDALRDLKKVAKEYLRDNTAEEDVRYEMKDVETLMREAVRLGLSDDPLVKRWTAFDKLHAGIKRRHRGVPSKMERMFLPSADDSLISEVRRSLELGERPRQIYLRLKRENPQLVLSQSAFYERLKRRHLRARKSLSRKS